MTTKDIAAIVQLTGEAEAFTERMKCLQKTYANDPEMFHRGADKMMMDTLSELGFSEGVSVFNNERKWYA